MPRVRLIHWNAGEAKERAAVLRAHGYTARFDLPTGPESLRELREDPPAAIVIDLTRLPSHGRDVALALRQTKSTRAIPLVFVEGAREKVERIRKLLPDAVYTSWEKIASALKQAIANPPAQPVVPESALAGYSGTPLAKKLGIRPNATVALVGAPPGFRKTLVGLPAGVVLRDAARGKCDLAVWFVPSQRELKSRIRKMVSLVGDGRLWIAWPKQASGVSTDLTQQQVREAGLAAGLVDFKICAIDATWSGLLFTRRKAR